jgi:hypothetical protein
MENTMKAITISAKLPKNEAKGRKEEKSAELTVQFPDIEADPDAALEEAKKAFGAKAILTNALSNWTVTLQGNIRSRLEKGQTQAQIQEGLGASKMGVSAPKVAMTSKEAVLAAVQTMSAEERKALIAQLMGQK